MSVKDEIRIRLVSKPVYLCGVRELITATLRRLSFDESQASQVALAVDEGLANVMKHGYEGRPDGVIELVFEPFDGDERARGGGVRITLEDEAKQVDPGAIKGRDLEDIRPGGLGVYIIREVMDEVAYEKREGGKGMRLTMVKYRSSPAKFAGGSSMGGCGIAGCCKEPRCDANDGEGERKQRGSCG